MVPTPVSASSKIESSLFLQELKIAEDVLLDFVRLGLGVDQLQLADNLGYGVLTIAARNDFQARAIKAKGTFRHQQDALIVVFSHAASCGEPRSAIQIHAHACSLAGWKAPGGGQPGFT